MFTCEAKHFLSLYVYGTFFIRNGCGRGSPPPDWHNEPATSKRCPLGGNVMHTAMIRNPAALALGIALLLTFATFTSGRAMDIRPAGQAVQSQSVVQVAARRCPACRIFCKRGYVCRCGRCVRRCRPQTVLCRRGYVWRCNRCVRRHR